MRNGEYYFAEAGTSSYSDKKIRNYERSGSAHNIIQMALIKKYTNKESISWIEPVDVWDNFRAGRKAKIIERNFGEDDKGNLWIIGAHDGFKKFGASHRRLIRIRSLNSSRLRLEVIDFIKTRKPMFVRQWWHLGLKVEKYYLEKIKSQIASLHFLKGEIIETEIAEGFGVRKSRSSLSINGILPEGEHILSVDLII